MKSTSISVFERRFDILLYAVRATEAFTAQDIYECVLECPRVTIISCLADLVSLGLMEKLTTTKYQASMNAKELLGVNTEELPDETE